MIKIARIIAVQLSCATRKRNILRYKGDHARYDDEKAASLPELYAASMAMIALLVFDFPKALVFYDCLFAGRWLAITCSVLTSTWLKRFLWAAATIWNDLPGFVTSAITSLTIAKARPATFATGSPARCICDRRQSTIKRTASMKRRRSVSPVLLITPARCNEAVVPFLSSRSSSMALHELQAHVLSY